MSKHTPGPWEVDDDDEYRPRGYSFTIEAWGCGRSIAAVIQQEELDGARANARLIAAAPKLFAVVERIARYCEQHSVPELQGIACDAFAVLAEVGGGAE
jgi:hypothetical protein